MAGPATPVRTLGGRVGRHTMVYGFGVAAMIGLALIQLGFYTRLLDPSEYGVLVVLLAGSIALSLLYTLGTLQGTLGMVFGRSDEDGVDVTGDEESDAAAAEAERLTKPGEGRREALSTGLIFITLLATTGTLAIVVFIEPIRELLGVGRHHVRGVQLAALAGGTGAVYRLLLAIPRLERRPHVFVALNFSRMALATAIAVAYLKAGRGPEAVIQSLLMANCVMLVVALTLLRRNLRLRFRPRLIPKILRLGMYFIPILAAFYVLSHGGLLILSRSERSDEVGLFGVAAQIAGLMLSLTAVFFTAWLPMKRTPLFIAVHKERGHSWVQGTLTTYFVIGLGTLVVLLTASTSLLVKLAGPRFETAERFLPVLALAAAFHALFLLAYRTTSFPRKRTGLVVLSLLAAALFVTICSLTVGRLGGYAVPLALSIAFLLTGGTMVVLGQRGPSPIDYEYGRLAKLGLLVLACVALPRFGPAAHWSRLPVDLGTIAVYFAGLRLLGIFRREDLRSFAGIGREMARPARRRDRGLAARLGELPPQQVATLRRGAAPRRRLARRPKDVAAATMPSPADFVAALRALTGVGEPSEHDDMIGGYLLADVSRAERDGIGRELWRLKVPPAEIDPLEEACGALRRLPDAAWPEHPAEVHPQVLLAPQASQR